MIKKTLITISGFSGAIAIGLGALGAHALKKIISLEQLKSFETGNDYHIYHTLALLILIFLSDYLPSITTKVITYLWSIGIVLFSGSIYLLACKDILDIANLTWIIGPITPIGGGCFIAGWLTLGIYGLKPIKNS